jgi:hypothetical protein
MGWTWQPTHPTIHIYYQVLREHKYTIEYQNIYEHFLATLYEFILCTLAPCMTDKTTVIIKRIGNWYPMEHGTYIRVYRAMEAPHLLPRFVLDKLVLQEVAYQTVIHRFGGIIYRYKKTI